MESNEIYELWNKYINNENYINDYTIDKNKKINNNNINKDDEYDKWLMENKQIGCINRDKNAVYNMEKIVNYYLLYKKHPER
jgi:hypothetical protein